MNKSQEVLLRLIQIAITGKTHEVPANPNWVEVIDLATEQGVLGICFDAIEHLPTEKRPDIDNLMEWLGQVSYQETQYEHNWEVACELDKLWTSAGITATVLKGRSIAQYYQKPNHRYSCDLDVLIPDMISEGFNKFQKVSSWERACQLLEEKGVKLCREVYKEVEFTYKDVYVECHRYITPVRGNKNLLSFERYLRSLLEAEHGTFEGTSLVCPPLMFTALLYVEHALGDFLREPLTLKHVTDWLVLRKRKVSRFMFQEVSEVSKAQFVSETFEARCKEFGFWRFLQLLDAIADVIEGKKHYEDLPATFKRTFDEMFERRKGSTRKKSWTERRVNQFFNVLKCGWKYKAFGYMSMPSYLYHTLRTHWFDKDVRI